MEEKETHASEQTTEETLKEQMPTHSLWAWIAFAITVAAWAVLILGSGYVALYTGIAGIVSGIIAVARTRHGYRKLSILALIASGVLTIVVAAFLVALRLI